MSHYSAWLTGCLTVSWLLGMTVLYSYGLLWWLVPGKEGQDTAQFSHLKSFPKVQKAPKMRQYSVSISMTVWLSDCLVTVLGMTGLGTVFSNGCLCHISWVVVSAIWMACSSLFFFFSSSLKRHPNQFTLLNTALIKGPRFHMSQSISRSGIKCVFYDAPFLGFLGCDCLGTLFV